jgi:hypothetical protein
MMKVIDSPSHTIHLHQKTERPIKRAEDLKVGSFAVLESDPQYPRYKGSLVVKITSSYLLPLTEDNAPLISIYNTMVRMLEPTDAVTFIAK